MSGTQLASYKRYWEPSLAQVLGVSLPAGAFITALTQPIEFVKTRVQLRTEGIGFYNKNHWFGINSHKVFREIHETGSGFRGFFVGLEAAILSRVGYLFVRNSLYKIIYDHNKPKKVTNDLSNKEKAVISGLAGGIAALATVPFELIMVRQIADGAIPASFRRNYLGLSDTYARVVAEEGSQALFKGGMATVLKAVAINISLTGPYDYLREKLWITFGDFGFIDPIATTWAAFWATVFTLPIDNVKTKMQRAFDDPSKNRINYSGFSSCLQKSMVFEGYTGIYVGAYPYFLKMLVTCYLTTYISSQATTAWKQKAGLKEWQI